MTAMTCIEVWKEMSSITANGKIEFNYHRTIDMSDYLIETDLFPKHVLEAYTLWNLGKDLNQTQLSVFSDQRGGGQGNYRSGITKKIDNVVTALQGFPHSKRAVIPITNNSFAHDFNDDDAKCMREIHFRLDGNIINATVLFRAQAALIFPKNIHFIGCLMEDIAHRISPTLNLGQLSYLASILVNNRE